MIRVRLGVCVCAFLAVPVLAMAQPPVSQPPPRGQVLSLDSLRARRDTTRRDTTEIVRWAEPDSVMRALMARAGYVITRYQAKTVTFNAATREIDLAGNTKTPAAVERDGGTTVGMTINYNDSLHLIRISPGPDRPAILRDPARNAADVIATGVIEYDIRAREARVREVCTQLESGEIYAVCSDVAIMLSDSTSDRRTTIAHSVRFTTCLEKNPHYHFVTRDFKMITKNLMVARNSVLYIADIPIFWLPFVFNDLRVGRRSGILTPRFGIAELLRNSSSYRRTVDNLGYYFALNDFMDAQMSLDWRSGARPEEGDPGYMRYSGELRYRIRDRFLTGSIAASHLREQDGLTNTSLSMTHTQDFSQDSHLSMSVNYVTSTRIQRRTEFVPYRALATIMSRANYQQRLGPFDFSLGGTRTQYPGQDQVDQTLPTLSMTTKPIDLASWLVWSPALSATNSQSLNVRQSGALAFQYRPGAGGVIDSVAIDRDTRNTSLSFETPLRIGGFTWRNSFRASDLENDFPESREIIDVRDTSVRSIRVFPKTFRTDIDWQTGISLPSISQGRWNLTPSVSIVNVDPSALWVRSERTGGAYVRQTKRPQYGLSASPTFFGLFPGFGRYERFRHSVSPSLSYSFSPAAEVSDEFLAALGRTRQGYLGSLAQNSVSLSISTNIEAKVRSAQPDSLSAGLPQEPGKKINVLALNFTSLSWDFERARVTKRTGLTNDRFGITARSDLLPGLDFGTTYSLFEGSSLSDTARFKPYREDLRASFTINRERNPFLALWRMFSPAVPRPDPTIETATPTQDDLLARQIASQQQVTGSTARNAQFGMPSSREWSANFTFSSSRQRPPVGSVTIIEEDDVALCSALGLDPFAQERCVQERQAARLGDPNAGQTTIGGPFYRRPPTTTIQSMIALPITRNWSATWQTTYDFEAGQFASHMVNLNRELHDWNATFSILQSPNGNFAFSFFIALKAQPELKFEHQRNSYRRPSGS